MLSRNASALRWHTVALLGLISLATGLHALAQPAGVEKRERYRLSNGDVIEVVVAGEPLLERATTGLAEAVLRHRPLAARGEPGHENGLLPEAVAELTRVRTDALVVLDNLARVV